VQPGAESTGKPHLKDSHHVRHPVFELKDWPPTSNLAPATGMAFPGGNPVLIFCSSRPAVSASLRCGGQRESATS
jgi:hypothetical protein